MNKVMLIGNVGKEPDVRYYAADQCVAHVRLATTERGYTLPNGTQVPDKTDWHNLTFSKGLAKVVEKYVHTGDKLYVEGRLRYNLVDDKRGQRQTIVDILVDNMEMLSAKNEKNPDEEKVRRRHYQRRKGQGFPCPAGGLRLP